MFDVIDHVPYSAMHLFGLTGGIASGKSSVSSTLEELGCPIIDADVIARQGDIRCYLNLMIQPLHSYNPPVVEPGKPALQLIVQNFGDHVLQSDGSLDRKKLGKIIFEDEAKRHVLNKCTHSYIQRAMMWEIVKYFVKGTSNCWLLAVLDVVFFCVV